MSHTRRVFLTALAAVIVAVPANAEARHRSPDPTPQPSGPTCGTTLYKADGSKWTCTFDDEFGGSSLNSANWVAQTTAASAFSSNRQDCYVDSSNNISVANGVLSLTTRKLSSSFTCSSPNGSYSTRYTSGMVMSLGKFSQTYGRWEVSAKFPASTVAGLQSSIWLWPNDVLKYGAYPKSGEIDIAEVYSQYNDRVIPYIHYLPAAVDTNVTNNKCMLNPATFHTYTLVWTASTLTISFDGTVCISDNWNPAAPLVKPAPFDSPFFMALTQGLGQGTNAFNASSTPLPATTQVDYVRVWK